MAMQLSSGYLRPIQRRSHACGVSYAPSTSFTQNAQLLLVRPTAPNGRVTRQEAVQPVAFKFLKQLGLKKPDFLPDFGLEKRKALVDRFYTSLDASALNEILADSFTMRERGSSKSFSKQEYIGLMAKRVKPAIPDYTWSHATSGAEGEDGFCVVKVQATGHHTGQPFRIDDNTPEVKASGKKFLLAEETQLVCVEDGKISKIEVLPSKGAGPRALYETLKSTNPASLADSSVESEKGLYV